MICWWRVLGHEVPVQAIVAAVEGSKKRLTLVTSALEWTGLQMVERFAARFRDEDGFRDLKQRLGWEECRAWTKNPIERTSQVPWVRLSRLRWAPFRLEAAGEVDWWYRPPWNKDQDRPSVLDWERLRRRHQGESRRFRSPWLATEEKVACGEPERNTEAWARSFQRLFGETTVYLRASTQSFLTPSPFPACL